MPLEPDSSGSSRGGRPLPRRPSVQSHYPRVSRLPGARCPTAAGQGRAVLTVSAAWMRRQSSPASPPVAVGWAPGDEGSTDPRMRPALAGSSHGTGRGRASLAVTGTRGKLRRRPALLDAARRGGLSSGSPRRGEQRGPTRFGGDLQRECPPQNPHCGGELGRERGEPRVGAGRGRNGRKTGVRV